MGGKNERWKGEEGWEEKMREVGGRGAGVGRGGRGGRRGRRE